MEEKLLIICGPTASGKTDLAARVAKKFNGVLVSADSRQVYKKLDIGTGKDIPKGVEIVGYDLVEPDEEFSVAQYVVFANDAIKKIWNEEKLPILVGGTGLYIKAVVDGIKTSSIPKNESLREMLSCFTVGELYNKLAQLDPLKAGSMNSSDKKNPRRLVRSIEVAQARLTKGVGDEQVRLDLDPLFIGIRPSLKTLKSNIKRRVLKRIKDGAEGEVKELLDSGVSWEDQSMSSLGYRQWKEYFEGKINRQEFVKKWEIEEFRYTKRQIVWWKKDKRINWFDPEKNDWQKSVENMVKKWYSFSNV